MDWEKLIGKEYFFKLKGGDVYNGIILEIENSNDPLIHIKDKYGDLVGIRLSFIIKYSQSKPKKREVNVW
jgi:hypothetical protein